jgi:hypothetical protein
MHFLRKIFNCFHRCFNALTSCPGKSSSIVSFCQGKEIFSRQFKIKKAASVIGPLFFLKIN